MMPQNFTTKSQQALQTSQHLALENGQSSLEPIHLLIALLDQEDGVVPAILRKLGTERGDLLGEAEKILEKLPHATMGGVGQLYISP